MKFNVIEPSGDWDGSCIFFLPGRGSHSDHLSLVYKKHLPSSLLVGLNPSAKAWYPMPQGPRNQKDAVEGLKANSFHLAKEILSFALTRKIPSKKIVLIGFSAGAVMALYTAITAPFEIGAVVSHCGCLLEPDDIPNCTYPNLPIYLFHSEDDQCFKWEERYLPTKNNLKQKNYRVQCFETSNTGHDISGVVTAVQYISSQLTVVV